MKTFEIVNIGDFNDSRIVDIDGLYDYFAEVLGETDADIVLDWAMQCRQGNNYEVGYIYMIVCREE